VNFPVELQGMAAMGLCAASRRQYDALYILDSPVTFTVKLVQVLFEMAGGPFDAGGRMPVKQRWMLVSPQASVIFTQ
jgi:hypothetical protein